MNEEEKQAIRDYAERWRRVAPILEEERRSRIRNMNTMEFIEATSDLYDFCLRTMEPRLTSGLIIQQALFRKIHEQSIKTESVKNSTTGSASEGSSEGHTPEENRKND